MDQKKNLTRVLDLKGKEYLQIKADDLLTIPSGFTEKEDPVAVMRKKRAAAEAKGEIILYVGKDKKNQLDKVKFELKKGQTKSYRYPKEKQTTKISVWVYKGAFDVKIDQS